MPAMGPLLVSSWRTSGVKEADQAGRVIARKAYTLSGTFSSPVQLPEAAKITICFLGAAYDTVWRVFSNKLMVSNLSACSQRKKGGDYEFFG
jgi:hypothetical protein